MQYFNFVFDLTLIIDKLAHARPLGWAGPGRPVPPPGIDKLVQAYRLAKLTTNSEYIQDTQDI